MKCGRYAFKQMHFYSIVPPNVSEHLNHHYDTSKPRLNLKMEIMKMCMFHAICMDMIWNESVKIKNQIHQENRCGNEQNQRLIISQIKIFSLERI